MKVVSHTEPYESPGDWGIWTRIIVKLGHTVGSSKVHGVIQLYDEAERDDAL